MKKIPQEIAQSTEFMAKPKLGNIVTASDVAANNIAYVFMQRLGDSFDEEQAAQALEALNGSIKEE